MSHEIASQYQELEVSPLTFGELLTNQEKLVTQFIRSRNAIEFVHECNQMQAKLLRASMPCESPTTLTLIHQADLAQLLKQPYHELRGLEFNDEGKVEDVIAKRVKYMWAHEQAHLAKALPYEPKAHILVAKPRRTDPIQWGPFAYVRVNHMKLFEQAGYNPEKLMWIVGQILFAPEAAGLGYQEETDLALKLIDASEKNFDF